jgi:xanthine dehydrogenase/oxidase
MVLQYSAIDDKVTHRSINACLCPLARLDGASVTTVEGLGDSVRGLRRPSP